jgi:hypothetical protein
MQHYFPVYFDTDTKRWSVDSDPTGFFDGSVWDGAEGEWRWPSDGTEEDFDLALYYVLKGLLNGNV